MKLCVRCKTNPRGNRTGIWTCLDCTIGLIENFVEPSGDTYVYSLIRGRGDKRRIVYIGMTNNPIERVARHFSSKTKKFTSMDLMKSFSDRSEAERFERRAIDLLK